MGVFGGLESYLSFPRPKNELSSPSNPEPGGARPLNPRPPIPFPIPYPFPPGAMDGSPLTPYRSRLSAIIPYP
ncbi:hypothetical protein OCU04_000354 [Sclerotinia nivalis]|uniref:Uncharacterized protein n=1 Tax=Sclerotinia nivalis TaxID=352851 RepID=A0A9X0DR75_9HELO|nr:hypothetical protein OCU04_000354 [Sclerotinia nivalis]